MVGWLTLALLMIDPSAARTDVSGGASTEVRGGWAPTTPTSESTPAFTLLVTPNIDLQHRHRRRGTVRLGYAPRMFLRLPNLLSVQRPLILHQIELDYARPLTRAWQFATNVQGRIGELDYTAAGTAFDPGQTNIPNVSVLSLAIVDGAVGFVGALNPQTSLTLGAGGGTRRQLSDAGDQGILAQSYGNFTVGPAFSLSARDDLQAGATVSLIDFDPGALFVAVDARLAWVHSIRSSLRLSLDAGVFITRVAARQDDPTGIDGATFPVGGIGLDGTMIARSNYSIGGGIAGSVFGVFDAASGRLLYRTMLNTGITAFFPPRWSAGIEASFVTAISREPLDDSAGFVEPETLVNLRTPITYTIDRTKALEFGVLAGARAPHLAADSFDTTRYEAWLYVAFRIAGSTARGGREVRRRSIGTY